ncbi:DNA polymerase lambda isoform X3 [Monodelphis domestica]|uniref:DNA polymerase lambda isoform X3 n=1 Tax=Monodelphis domestica TaxID=13616 RepID=UPI0004435664|nr:DNA polymerase lambda isoform X3 [Monodelphis domestica]
MRMIRYLHFTAEETEAGREKGPDSPLAMEPRGILKAFPKRKKMRTASDGSGLLKIPKKEKAEAGEWLSPLQVHVLPVGIGRARAEIFEKQIIQHGGQICSPQAPGITHIVVDETVDGERALRLLKLPQLPLGAQLVKSAWLSQCLKEQKLVDTDGFHVVFIPNRYLDKADISFQPGPSGTSAQAGLSSVAPLAPPQEPHSRLGIQAQANSDDEDSDEEEVRVTPDDLEALITGRYPSTPEGDTEPSLAPNLSEKWVCAQPSSQKMTNHNLHITEKLEVLAKAYAVQGDRWRTLGYSKAINALKSFPKPVSSYQVRETAHTLNPGLLSVACGSYRRGKATCGDVDVLVTHPDGRSHQGIFSQLLDALRKRGFLTDDLVSQDDNGQQQKYLGVCQLPGPGRHHRRLDIIVVPYSEFACALLYFTGSAYFNRSMRALAKTKGMSLSEHALSTAIVRDGHGVKVGPGRALPTPTEKDVFKLLGLPYREPSERDW